MGLVDHEVGEFVILDQFVQEVSKSGRGALFGGCLLYTSDAADE